MWCCCTEYLKERTHVIICVMIQAFYIFIPFQMQIWCPDIEDMISSNKTVLHTEICSVCDLDNQGGRLWL